MCNNYRIRKAAAEIASLFDARIMNAQFDPEKDLYPKGLGPVIRQENGERLLNVMRWGFPPPAQARAPVTNVRNLGSPFWKSALARPDRRCIVPVTEFCEWEGETGSKVKRWFSVPSREIFAFAGVWRPTEDGPAYAFLTCEPNEVVRPIHAKAMPVILHDEDFDGWLSGDYDNICALASPYPSQLMAVA